MNFCSNNFKEAFFIRVQFTISFIWKTKKLKNKNIWEMKISKMKFKRKYGCLNVWNTISKYYLNFKFFNFVYFINCCQSGLSFELYPYRTHLILNLLFCSINCKKQKTKLLIHTNSQPPPSSKLNCFCWIDYIFKTLKKENLPNAIIK